MLDVSVTGIPLKLTAVRHYQMKAEILSLFLKIAAL